MPEMARVLGVHAQSDQRHVALRGRSIRQRAAVQVRLALSVKRRWPNALRFDDFPCIRLRHRRTGRFRRFRQGDTQCQRGGAGIQVCVGAWPAPVPEDPEMATFGLSVVQQPIPATARSRESCGRATRRTENRSSSHSALGRQGEPFRPATDDPSVRLRRPGRTGAAAGTFSGAPHLFPPFRVLPGDPVTGGRSP